MSSAAHFTVGTKREDDNGVIGCIVLTIFP
jgi:hypothetical protein